MRREYICIDPVEYKRLLSERRQTVCNNENKLTNTNDERVDVEDDVQINDDVDVVEINNLIQRLPTNSRATAQQILKHLISTQRFVYITTTGEIIIDEELIVNTNLLDLLLYLTSDVEVINQTGLNPLMLLLASTSFPSFMLDNINVRKLFVEIKV